MTKEQQVFEHFIKDNYFTYTGDCVLLDKDCEGNYSNREIKEYWYVWQSAKSGIYEKEVEIYG